MSKAAVVQRIETAIQFLNQVGSTLAKSDESAHRRLSRDAEQHARVLTEAVGKVKTNWTEKEAKTK